VGLILLLITFCCIRRCCRKRRPKDAKKGAKGAVDLKSVQLLGNAYKEKVRPHPKQRSDYETLRRTL